MKYVQKPLNPYFTLGNYLSNIILSNWFQTWYTRHMDLNCLYLNQKIYLIYTNQTFRFSGQHKTLRAYDSEKKRQPFNS